MSDKKGLLPIVSEDTGHAVQAELLHSRQSEYVSELLERLQEDNPRIAEFVSRLANKCRDPTAVTYGSLLVYRLLESQAEADELKRGSCEKRE